jgi:hypothetical protein
LLILSPFTAKEKRVTTDLAAPQRIRRRPDRSSMNSHNVPSLKIEKSFKFGPLTAKSPILIGCRQDAESPQSEIPSRHLDCRLESIPVDLRHRLD